MKTQSVRNLLLNGHASLREQLRNLQKNGHDEQRLRDGILSLCNAVLGHMDVEEVILRPILARESDRTRDRLRQMEDEHEAQRIRVKLLQSAARDDRRPVEDLRESLEGFVAFLTAEMEGEERDLL